MLAQQSRHARLISACNYVPAKSAWPEKLWQGVGHKGSTFPRNHEIHVYIIEQSQVFNYETSN
jgi:hypothetical protein